MVSPTPRMSFVCVCVTVGLLNTRAGELKVMVDVLCNNAAGLMNGRG